LVSKGIMLKVLKGIKDRGLNSRFRVGLIVPEGTPNPETGVAMADGIYAPKIATHAHLANLAKAALAAKGANRFYSYDSGTETITGRAEQYYSTLAAYQETDGTVRSCRRNYEIMLFPDHTTVDWRFKIGTASSPGPLYTAINKYGVTAANSDNCTDTFSDGSLYCPQPSAVAGTFADLVWTGWRTDLINLDNTILTSRRDPATWQHVSRYVIAPYGVSNITPAIDETAQKTWYSTSYPRYDTFEDVYHMALNGRGRFYTYESMDKATEGVLEAFFDILNRNTTGSAVATNTTALVTSGTVYQAALDNDWRGRMRAYGITISGNTATIGSTPIWDGANTVSAQSLTYSSGAVDTGDIADRRRIFTSIDQTPKAFRWGSFTSAQLDGYGLTGDASEADKERYSRLMINYLRGYAACEQNTACGTYVDSGAIATTRSLEFRRRQLEINEDKRTILTPKQPDGRNTLGDIANSSPWYIGPPLIGLSDIDYPGYNAFYRDNKARRPVVYVGGNDGMLHAFDAITTGCTSETTCNSVGAGRELFAYIPSLVLSNLTQLANKSYDHRYYVDGSPFSAEVYSNGAWRTVLVGGLNRGGKGYYALDVTADLSDSIKANWVGEASVTVNSHIASSNCNGGCSTTYAKLPTTSTKTIEDNLAASKFLWEFTEADMGYSYNSVSANRSTGQARQIVRTKVGSNCSSTDIAKKNNCKWAVIVGNGYNDTAGSPAALYVIFVDGPGADKIWDSGTDYVKIPVGTVLAPHTSYDDGLNTNGLSSPTPYDKDNDGFVDYVYAGDINGNLWKFDISSDDASLWAVSNGGKPIFVAKDGSGTPRRQPIIAPPLIIKHTATQKPLILFGTGKLIDSTDVTNTDTQSFYAVLEHLDSENTSLTRSSLFPRTATTLSVNDGSAITSNNLRVMNQASFAYCTAYNPTTCTISDDDVSSNDKYFGWYWDMPTSGERITGVPQPVRTEVRFNTYIPNLSDPCKYGGDGWAMCLNMQTGLQGCKSSSITLPTEYQYNGLSLFGGRRTGAAIGGASFIPTLGGDLVVIDSAMGQSNESVPRASIEDGGGYKGRVSWYELTD
jgi:type IV pilus assembly protein PilY1